jgi:hypothetical protein
MTKTRQKFLTRFLAAAAMVAIYCVSTLALSGVVLTGATTSAEAQRGRGRGRGGGRGRGRGWGRGGGGLWLAPLVVPPRWCHRPYSSRTYRCW